MIQTHQWQRRTNARGEIRLFGRTFDLSTGPGRRVTIRVAVEIKNDDNKRPCRKWYVGQMLASIGAREARAESRSGS